MAIIVGVFLNLDDANAAVNKFQADTADAFKKTGENLNDAFKSGADAAIDQIKALRAEIEKLQTATGPGAGGGPASKAAENLASIAANEELEKIRGLYNDARDIFDVTSGSLLGFAESQRQAASESAFLFEKALVVGLGIGGIAGPLGIVVGLMLSYAHWQSEAAKRSLELNTKIRESQAEFDALLDTARQFGAETFDLGAGVNSIKAQQEALKNLKEEYKDVAETVAYYQALAKNSPDSIVRADALIKLQELEPQLARVTAAQDKLTQSTLAFYQAASVKVGQYGEDFEEAFDKLDYIGRSRPLDVIAKDADKAAVEFRKFRDAAKESDQKIKDIEKALGPTGNVIDLVTVAMKYNITSQEGMKKAVEDNAQAHTFLQNAVAKLSAVWTEQHQVQEEQARKRKEWADKAKENREHEVQFNRELLAQQRELLATESALFQQRANERNQRDQELATFSKGAQAKLDELAKYGPEIFKANLGALVDAINQGGDAADIFLDKVKTFASTLNPVFTEAQAPLGFLAERLNGIREGLGDIEVAAESAFMGAGVNAVNTFFTAIEEGKKKALTGMGAAFLGEMAAFSKAKGSELIVQGLVDELLGFSKILRGVPGGGLLMKHGLAEMAQGFALGGVGIVAGRAGSRMGGRFDRANPDDDARAGGSSLGGAGSAGLGGGVNRESRAPVVYQIYMGGAPGSTTINAGDGPASTAQAARDINRITAQGNRIGSGGISRRKP